MEGNKCHAILAAGSLGGRRKPWWGLRWVKKPLSQGSGLRDAFLDRDICGLSLLHCGLANCGVDWYVLCKRSEIYQQPVSGYQQRSPDGRHHNRIGLLYFKKKKRLKYFYVVCEGLWLSCLRFSDASILTGWRFHMIILIRELFLNGG